MTQPLNDLSDLIRRLNVQVHEGAYAFATVKSLESVNTAALLGTFIEEEGLTIIVTESEARRLKLESYFRAAWLTLGVHSDLNDVGLTATVSTALSRGGISCNIVAAMNHDHLFVPYEQKDDALSRLQDLSNAASRLIAGLHHVQITIPTGAEEEAIDFYCNCLQLSLEPRPASLADRGGFWLNAGDRNIHVGVEDGINRHASKAHVAYRVFNLETCRKQLELQQVETLAGVSIPGVKRLECRDPFGNRVELVEDPRMG